MRVNTGLETLSKLRPNNQLDPQQIDHKLSAKAQANQADACAWCCAKRDHIIPLVCSTQLGQRASQKAGSLLLTAPSITAVAFHMLVKPPAGMLIIENSLHATLHAW